METLPEKEQIVKWELAKKLVKDLIDRRKRAEETGEFTLFYDTEEKKVVTGEFVIDEGGIYLLDSGCRFGIFINDAEYDDGMYDSLEEIKQTFSRYKIFAEYKG